MKESNIIAPSRALVDAVQSELAEQGVVTGHSPTASYELAIIPSGPALRSTTPPAIKEGSSPSSSACSSCGLRLLQIDQWQMPVTVEETNFKYKSLSAFIVNPAVGCTHGCRFCYVPDTSANKQAPKLKALGIDDPDEQWGQYLFVRPWDEKEFLASLKRAENTPAAKLNRDGHRAVMFSSTTDPFQVVKFPGNISLARELQKQLEDNVTRALELILKSSTLRVRILTRNPLAQQHFELMKKFGDRLLFGMSLPSLNHQFTDIYEPGAPHPQKRLETLQKAKEAGLNIYVAVAPTYPECNADDLRRTLRATKDLKPVTIFHEPINIRAKNVERIRLQAEKRGISLNTDVFKTTTSWRKYAIDQLRTMQQVAKEEGMGDRLHLWPDTGLGAEGPFKDARQATFRAQFPDKVESVDEKKARKKQDQNAYLKFRSWLDKAWNRISEWPGEEVAK